MPMTFFLGVHQLYYAHEFACSFISVNRLKERVSAFLVGKWIMDSGAFTEVSTWGGYRDSVFAYARLINRWKDNGEMLAAVAQDYMCEAFILKKTGLTVIQHQAMTVARYAQLKPLCLSVYILPVLQGYEPWEYVHHVMMYEQMGFLPKGAWVGVGSICKRNANPEAILAVLGVIKRYRPDLLLHGFGLKLTALADPRIRAHLHTADSMAWSYAARMKKRAGIGLGANSPIEAHLFCDRINNFLLNDY